MDLKIVAAAILLVLLIGCIGEAEKELPSRESKIPGNATKMFPETDSLKPILNSQGWMEPVPVSGMVNTGGAEDSAFVMPDGKTIYFFFTPDPNVPAEKQLFDEVTGIYSSEWNGQEWGDAKRIVLQDNGKLALDGCEFVSGSEMWFCSAREGFTGINLFTAELKDGKWTNWKFAGSEIKEKEVGEMHITADGKEMYFHSPRSGGKSGLDIWVMKRSGSGWGAPENVEAANSVDNEGWPFITQDGKELWFTRFYRGSPAIFRSKRIGETWGEPELILSQFAGEPSLDNEGNIYFTHHFYRDGKMIEADIYVAKKR